MYFGSRGHTGFMEKPKYVFVQICVFVCFHSLLHEMLKDC